MIEQKLLEIKDRKVAALVEKQILERIQRILDTQDIETTAINWNDPYNVDKWYSKIGYYGVCFDKASKKASTVQNPPKLTELPNLPSNPVVVTPNLTVEHTTGTKWDYPALIEAAEAANPGERYSRADIRDMKKPKIAELRAIDSTAKPHNLEPIKLDNLVEWAKAPYATGNKVTDTILSLLMNKDKKQLTKGAMEYLEVTTAPLEKPLELPEPERVTPTPEVLATLASQLEPRHFSPTNGNIARLIIAAELYKATGIVYDLSKLSTSMFKRPN